MLGPSSSYPGKHVKFTVLPNWNNQPSRLPLTGDPGSPQLTADKNKNGVYSMG